MWLAITKRLGISELKHGLQSAAYATARAYVVKVVLQNEFFKQYLRRRQVIKLRKVTVISKLKCNAVFCTILSIWKYKTNNSILALHQQLF